MSSFNNLLIDLGRAIIDLFQILRGAAHGVFRGTHEAVLFEAQGGQIGPDGYDHLQDLRATAAAIEARQDLINLALNRIQGINGPLGVRLKQICEPLLRQSGEFLKTAADTERAAVALRSTDPTRFENVILAEGGLGPEVGRTEAALVSNQLNRIASQLAARGIEPRLIPSIRASLQSVAAGIRQLPLDTKDTTSRVGGVLAAMRALVSAAARQALLAGRTLLTAALLEIEEALVFIGARLTLPVIVIPPGFLHNLNRAAGIELDSHA